MTPDMVAAYAICAGIGFALGGVPGLCVGLIVGAVWAGHG